MLSASSGLQTGAARPCCSEGLPQQLTQPQSTPGHPPEPCQTQLTAHGWRGGAGGGGSAHPPTVTHAHSQTIRVVDSTYLRRKGSVQHVFPECRARSPTERTLPWRIHPIPHQVPQRTLIFTGSEKSCSKEAYLSFQPVVSQTY